ncbi:glycosyltransferase family 2 protein [Candidatus Dojkabacteria bacterium]|nr:glycosyltransferase family 2 protein [Candidatus Dojkabacteria bacterium]
MQRNNQKLTVSVVITNYNGKELLEKNLPAIISAKNNKDNNILEIIVVDDFSNDESLKFLNTLKSDISIIKHTKNRGFSATTNTGVRATKGDFVALLNSDVSPSSNFLVSTLKLFEDSQVFGVTFHEKGLGYAKALFSDGYIQQPGGKEVNKVVPSFYTSGGSGIFRKSIWKELGGMDEKLLSPFYWEDIDLSYRANKRGYLSLWDPNAIVVHNHMSTISKLPKKNVDMIRERNQLLVLWKNIHSKNMLNKHFASIMKRTLKHPGYMKVIFSALFKLPLVLKERKKEIKESIVSDEAVFQKYQ